MKLTIGIPFYNPGEYFFDSVKSILLQSFNDFELILIDDGSSDDSLTVAKSFSDPRIVVVSDNLNLGLPARLNQIVNLSRGEYIARMDADDLVSLERLAKQVQFLDENPDIDIVSTGICSISNNCEFMSVRIPKFTKRLDLNLDDGIKGATGVAHATIMARKSWCLRNRYDESAKLMEDYQLWIDSLIRNDLKVGFIKEPLYFYREEISVQYEKVIQSYKNQSKIVSEKYAGMIPLKTRVLFSIEMKAKMLITWFFNLFGVMNSLISLRNRGTLQDDKWRRYFDKEISKIHNSHEGR